MLPAGLALTFVVLGFAFTGYAFEERADPRLASPRRAPAVPRPAGAAPAGAGRRPSPRRTAPSWRSPTSTSPTSESAPAVVRGVSFDAPRGRVTALVGESGSGKSTIVMALLGLLPGDAVVKGAATFEGQKLSAAPAPARLRGRRIGLVTQAAMNALNPAYTVHAQVAEAAALTMPDGRGRPAGHRAAGRRRPAGARPRRLPARAVRRHAPAGGHRHGPGQPARPAHRGRAHHRARPGHPGLDPAPAATSRTAWD